MVGIPSHRSAATIGHVVRAAHAGLVPSGVPAQTTDTAKESSPPARTAGAQARSALTSIAETFVDSARALVRKARAWDREALEHLSHILGQIEASLRDGGARAREGPRK